MNEVSSVLVGCIDEEIWIRIEGRGSFQNSAGLKEFARQMIQKGHRKFVVDLKKCILMDSTFVGTLTGIALRLRNIGQGNMRVIDANSRNTDLLKNLGLDHLFETNNSEDSSHLSHPPEVRKLKEKTPLPPDVLCETVYSAHEALVEAHPENKALFQDVLQYLKEEKAKPFPNP